MARLWVLALAGFLVSGCTSLKHTYAHIPAHVLGRAEAATWRRPGAARSRTERWEFYRPRSEREEARARRERSRREGEQSYRRWFKSLTEDEQARVRRRERELDSMLEALAKHSRQNV